MLARSSAAYLEGLLARDSARSRAVVERLVGDGVDAGDVLLEVLAPALAELGHRWAVGETGVADEHYATALTAALIGELRPALRVPPRDGRLALVASTPGEHHDVGGRIVAAFLEHAAWEVLELGASTPAADLVAFVDDEQPDVVALSTSTPGRLPGVIDTVERLRALAPPPFVALGGGLWRGAVRAEADALGADLITDDPRVLVAALSERFPPPAVDEAG